MSEQVTLYIPDDVRLLLREDGSVEVHPLSERAREVIGQCDDVLIKYRQFAEEQLSLYYGEGWDV